MDIEAIKENFYNLSISLYVKSQNNVKMNDIQHALESWKVSSVKLKRNIKVLFDSLDSIGYEIDREKYNNE